MPELPSYKYRYLVEPWGKPPDVKEVERESDTVILIDGDYGYADDVVVFSIVRQEDGSVNIIAITAEDGAAIPRAKLTVLHEVLGQMIADFDAHVGSN